MITILENPAEATVETFAELKTAVEDTTGDYKAITTVYLTQDMTHANAAVTVPLSKPAVVIDGTYGGVRHQFTTYSNSLSYLITTANPGTGKQAMDVTMRHMDIIGNNYYGAMGAADSNNFFNVTLTYEDVNYTGAQTMYNRYGAVRYIGGSYDINYHEVAECGRVTLGGNLTINHTMASYSSFWMNYNASDQYFRVLEGADVTITAAYAVVYISTGAQFIVEDNARLVIEAPLGIAFNTAAYAAFTIGQGAYFKCTQ
ncbi:MAG: hypothetical protein LBV27_00820, partial [Oscillospiraceae bacterium]|nr:hypothetical protein [Oscillospiraceae bacterium]